MSELKEMIKPPFISNCYLCSAESETLSLSSKGYLTLRCLECGHIWDENSCDKGMDKISLQKFVADQIQLFKE